MSIAAIEKAPTPAKAEKEVPPFLQKTANNKINTLAKLKKISADADTNAGVTIVLIGAYLRSSV